MSQAGSTLPENNRYFAAVDAISDYITQFGMGDWGESIRYVTPEDWKSWGNPYPSEGMDAIAVMSYGGVWCDVMNGEAVEIRDNFLSWVKDQGWNYEIQNETALIIYNQPSDDEPINPLEAARREYQSASSMFERVPSNVNFLELQRTAAILLRESDLANQTS